MDFSQLKTLAFCVAVPALVGCGTASKKIEHFNPQSMKAASMVGDAQPGDLVSLPGNSGLGMDSVVVDRTYIAASGRQCRYLRTIDGAPIQRVACKASDGVWSLARDLRPSTSIDPTNPGTTNDINVSRSDDINQSLVPSAGSLMLLHKQKSLSKSSTSRESVGELAPGESVMQAGAEALHINRVKPDIVANTESVMVVPGEYAAPIESITTKIAVAEAAMPVNASSVTIVPAQYTAQSSQPTNVEPLHISADVYAVQEQAAPDLAVRSQPTVTEASMLARAEALIISSAEYSEQIGVQPLIVGSDEFSAPAGVEPLSPGAAESEIKTVIRTVNFNETLWSFAKRTTGNALNWETIAQINGISDVKTLATGAELLVPAELAGHGG